MGNDEHGTRGQFEFCREGVKDDVNDRKNSGQSNEADKHIVEDIEDDASRSTVHTDRTFMNFNGSSVELHGFQLCLFDCHKSSSSS